MAKQLGRCNGGLPTVGSEPRQKSMPQVECELVSPKSEPISESEYEHFQEEEFFGQRLPPQLGAFGLEKYPRDTALFREMMG